MMYADSSLAIAEFERLERMLSMKPEQDAERIKAIREMATAEDPASLIDYLVVSGATIEDATAAFESVRATGFWQNESGENRWGIPKET